MGIKGERERGRGKGAFLQCKLEICAHTACLILLRGIRIPYAARENKRKSSRCQFSKLDPVAFAKPSVVQVFHPFSSSKANSKMSFNRKRNTSVDLSIANSLVFENKAQCFLSVHQKTIICARAQNAIATLVGLRLII